MNIYTLGILFAGTVSVLQGATAINFLDTSTNGELSGTSGSATLSVTASGTSNPGVAAVSDTDFSLSAFTPTFQGDLPSFSFNNDGGTQSATFEVTDPLTQTITAVHIFGLLNSLDFSESFTILSADGITNPSANLITGSSSGTGNINQGHATLVFDAPVTSFTVTENGGGGSDVVFFQFSGEVVPEPSSSLLLALSFGGALLRRRRA